MPRTRFRDLTDPDEKRREIVWLAISFIVILATWLAVVLVFGYQPLVLGMTYDEVVLVAGLGLLVFCMVLYLAAREREQRQANRRLVNLLREAAARLDQRLEQLKGLCSTSAELAGTLDRDQISHTVVASLADALAAPAANRAPAAASLILLEADSRRPVYAQHAPSGAAFESVEGDLLRDALPDLTGASADLSGEDHDRFLIYARIPLNNGLTGVLGARRPPAHEGFSPDDLWLLTTLANMAAKAIESAQLHTDLRESYLATVRSLVTSLHARDNYTAAHSQRVVSLAIRISDKMNLGESLIRDLEVFGPLHDVGKIGIRDEVLLKASPLSQEEQVACRQHCVIGEHIISPLRPSPEALSMVRNHHECWDGQGYPDGLAGDEIPLLARVLKVADCYDAMTSARPYQPALSQQEVLAHFRQYSGKHYDPAVVQALAAAVQDSGPPAAGGPARRKSTAATAPQGGSSRSTADVCASPRHPPSPAPWGTP